MSPPSLPLSSPLVIVVSPCRCPSPWVVLWLLAPAPPCEQRLVVVGVVLTTRPPRKLQRWCRPVPLGRHSTHHPPHEQLLVRLEAGGVWSVIVVGPCRGLGSAVLYSHSTARPPHEQWFVAVVWCAFVVSAGPPAIHPTRVAREGGAAGSSWRPGAIRRRRRVVTRYPPSELA